MIKLDELRVKNYRSLVDTDVVFRTNLTALIGANGVGKTNTLNAILLLRKMIRAASKQRRYSFGRKSYDESSHSLVEVRFTSNSGTYSLKADLYFDNTEENDPISYFKLRMRDMNEKPARWLVAHDDALNFIQYIKSRGNRKPFSTAMTRKYITKSDGLNDALIDFIDYVGSISYYSATQFSDPTKSPISLELEDNRLSRPRSRYKNHEGFIYDLFYKYKFDRKAFARYLNTIGNAGLALIDNIEFKENEIPSSTYKVLTGGHIKKISTKRTIVIPFFTVDDLQLSPTQLSEGTFKTLALIFYILNDNNNLLLIEEPEVCVHHGLLGSVIELIKIQTRVKQVVVSTHSDYVVDRLLPDNIVLVTKTAEGTKARTVDKALSRDDFKSLRLYLNEIGNLGDFWKEGGFLDD